MMENCEAFFTSELGALGPRTILPVFKVAFENITVGLQRDETEHFVSKGRDRCAIEGEIDRKQ